MGERICSIPGCGRTAPSNRRGWCGVHYSRWRTKGDPLAAMTRDPDQSDADRFWSHVDAGDCWHWVGPADTSGYGSFAPRGSGSKPAGAHRWAYELLVGTIPDGLQLDHLCRNRRCVNPDHLEPVTREENFRRGVVSSSARLRTHCKYGHEWTAANTYTKAGKRVCRECARRACRAHYHRTKATNGV